MEELLKEWIKRNNGCQLYKKDLPDKQIKTAKGNTTYYAFLCTEKERLESLGRKAKIDGGGLRDNQSRHSEICLYVNKIA